MRREFEIWQGQPEVVVHRQTKWKISHMPSLHDVSPTEYLFISKSSEEHQKIKGIFYDKKTHLETRSLEIGDNDK